MHRLVVTGAICAGALLSLPGCLTTAGIDGDSRSGRVEVMNADRATVWASLVQQLDARNVQLLEVDRDRWWLRTDFIYFRPMEFGEPVLAGKKVMGDYVDVVGGRYRLIVQLSEAGSGTSVRVSTELQRLEKRPGTPQVEPSFSLDASAGRGYVIGVPQPSNGVIERHFLGELKAAVGAEPKGPAPAPPGRQRD
ncbi:MAG TPA: hypothetical protein VLY45_00130 [Nitrospiria bacterium]|nr:hypothetical protein [Nitrospiria bacterium]